MGCGIIYSVKRPGTGSIFFTKNGEYLGECRSGGTWVRLVLGPWLTRRARACVRWASGVAFPEVPITQKWYPVVGIDTACCLEINPGTIRPFVFDLLAFEQRVWSALVVSPVRWRACPSARPTAHKSECGCVPTVVRPQGPLAYVLVELEKRRGHQVSAWPQPSDLFWDMTLAAKRAMQRAYENLPNLPDLPDITAFPAMPTMAMPSMRMPALPAMPRLPLKKPWPQPRNFPDRFML